MAISWFDPLTGKYLDGGRKEFGGGWLGIERPAGISGPLAIAVLEKGPTN